MYPGMSRVVLGQAVAVLDIPPMGHNGRDVTMVEGEWMIPLLMTQVEPVMVDGLDTSLIPSPPPQLSSLIRTASDDSCGGGLGTRLAGHPPTVLVAGKEQWWEGGGEWKGRV